MFVFSKEKSFFNLIKRKFFPFHKSKEVKKIFSILSQDSENKQVAMFVGGCVRKYLSNEKIDDIDIATVYTPHQVIEKFKNSNIEVKKTGIDHGTLTLVLNNRNFEITTLREDISTDGRHANVSFTDNWDKDSERRDFTINAIYLNQKGKVFDPQLGAEDLKKKEIKFIGDPQQRIKEDYLRILRYIRFSIQYEDFKEDSAALKAIQLNLNGITKLSKERVYSELEKILKLKNFEDIFKSKMLLDIFRLIFPEFKYLERAKNFTKIRSLKEINLQKDIILASLLIDSSNNHEYFSHKHHVSNEIKNILNFYAKCLKLTNQNQNFFEKDLRKNIFYHGKEKIKLVFLLYSIINDKIEPSKLATFISKVDGILIPKFPISGDYLKKHGYKTGKILGKKLKSLEEKWIENNFVMDKKVVEKSLDEINKN